MMKYLIHQSFRLKKYQKHLEFSGKVELDVLLKAQFIFYMGKFNFSYLNF